MRREIHEHDFCVGSAGFERKPRLANPTATRQREQTSHPQKSPNFGDLLIASNEAGQGNWDRRRLSNPALRG
jgi:hypothetical protein